jgi:hypothetical protein
MDEVKALPHSIQPYQARASHLSTASLHRLKSRHVFDSRDFRNMAGEQFLQENEPDKLAAVARKMSHGALCVLLPSDFHVGETRTERRLHKKTAPAFPSVVRVWVNQEMTTLLLAERDKAAFQSFDLSSGQWQVTVTADTTSEGFHKVKEAGFLQTAGEKSMCLTFRIYRRVEDDSKDADRKDAEEIDWVAAAEWNLQVLSEHASLWAAVFRVFLNLHVDSNDNSDVMLSALKGAALACPPFEYHTYKVIQGFNKPNSKFWAVMQDAMDRKLLETDSVETVAQWLHKHTFIGLDRHRLAQYFASAPATEVCHWYVKYSNFMGLSLPTALRHLMHMFDFTIEPTLKKRVLRDFAETYYKQQVHHRQTTGLLSTATTTNQTQLEEEKYFLVQYPNADYIYVLCEVILDLNATLLASFFPEGSGEELEPFVAEARHVLKTFQQDWKSTATEQKQAFTPKKKQLRSSGESATREEQVLASVAQRLSPKRAKKTVQKAFSFDIQAEVLSSEYIDFIARDLHTALIEQHTGIHDIGYELGTPLFNGWVSLVTVRLAGFFRKKKLLRRRFWAVLTVDRLCLFDDTNATHARFEIELKGVSINTVVQSLKTGSDEVNKVLSVIEAREADPSKFFFFQGRVNSTMKLIEAPISVPPELEASSHAMFRRLSHIDKYKKGLRLPIMPPKEAIFDQNHRRDASIPYVVSEVSCVFLEATNGAMCTIWKDIIEAAVRGNR